ncbi:dioxygenase [Streptomyces sp. NPDC051985]|uniref:dioxygenase n=1 Tax=Streptomyces sp. NPDC051985 TaxID=3155807 RepID=UPI0034438434
MTVTTDRQRQVEDELVRTVLAAFDGTPDPRLKELMQALVRHLHSFMREVRLTEAEWQCAIDFLAAAGHITTDHRQEFVLLSDVLGASMQAINIGQNGKANVTENTVLGPFFVDGSPEIPLGGDMAAGAVGEPCWVEGTVTGTDGPRSRSLPTPATRGLGAQTGGRVITPPHRKFKKNAPDWDEEIHEGKRKAHFSRRIRVEHGIAHLKNWRALACHLGRREHMSDIVRAVAGLLSHQQTADLTTTRQT